MSVPGEAAKDSPDITASIVGEHIEREPLVDDELADRIVARLDETDGTDPEGAVEQGEGNAPPTSPAPAPSGGPTDSEGTVFNPRIHYLDENGKPKKTATGKFRKRRKDSPMPTETSQTQAAGLPDPKQSAELVISVGESVAVASLGELWTMKEPEKAFLGASLERYFAASGTPDVPPGWLLIAAIGLYALPRIMHPETQARIGKLMGKHNAHSDTWNDGEREERAQQTSSQEPERARENSGSIRPAWRPLGG